MTFKICNGVVGLLLAGLGSSSVAAELPAINGPDGRVRFILSTDSAQGIRYEVRYDRHTVLSPARIGLRLDGNDLGAGATLQAFAGTEHAETYPTRGVHAVARNEYRQQVFQVTGEAGAAFIEVRAFNDGVAFRWRVPSNGRPRVPDAATDFRLPAGSLVWYHDLVSHYEGQYVKRLINPGRERGAFPSPRPGDWAGVPLVYKLPEGAGYAYISESALMNYPGMALQAGTEGLFRERLGHAHPPSYPYVLRYTLDEADRLAKPASFDGEIVTPWRVVAVAPDLNGLVNSDLITNLAPPPDPELFPQGQATPWIRPGRALWRYLDGGENTFEEMKNFADLARQLGFEHNVIEGFWRRWTPEQMRELVTYSKERDVSVWFWRHSNALRTPEARREFFALCRDLGVAGAKIDFLDHEAREVIDLYQELLRESAKHQVMVNFHGSNKSSGEPRTWPHELTREGIYGLEYSSATARAAHNATVPFTRFLVGPADYTPVIFTERRRDTTAAHQIATAAVFTSPLMIYAAHPRALLDSPAVEVIKAIPATWDETVVLPPSEIGELAAYARRSGDTWILALVNGPEARTVSVPLAFLAEGERRLLGFGDADGDPLGLVRDERAVTRADTLTLRLAPGGGYIARIAL